MLGTLLIFALRTTNYREADLTRAYAFLFLPWLDVGLVIAYAIEANRPTRKLGLVRCAAASLVMAFVWAFLVVGTFLVSLEFEFSGALPGLIASSFSMLLHLALFLLTTVELNRRNIGHDILAEYRF